MSAVSKVRAFLQKEAVGIAGLVLAAASLVVSVFAIQAARDLAMDSGSLNRPDLVLGLGTFKATDSDINALFFIDTSIAEKGVVITADLPLTIANLGTSSEEDVILVVQYFSRQGSSPGFGDVASDLMERSGAINVGISREVMQSDSWLSINYEIDEIRPDVSIGLAEPFVLPHAVNVSAPVTLADGVSAVVDLRVDFGIVIPVILSKKNGEVMSYNLSISSMIGQGDDRDSLQEYVARIQKDYRDSRTFFEYLITGLVGVEHSFYYMKQTTSPYISDQGIHLFTREAEALSFSLFNKGLLFRASTGGQRSPRRRSARRRRGLTSSASTPSERQGRCAGPR